MHNWPPYMPVTFLFDVKGTHPLLIKRGWNPMTKTKTTADVFGTMSDAFEKAQAQFELPSSAREAMRRAAATAKEQAETVHAGAAEATARAEKLMTDAFGTYAEFTRGLIDASLANVRHAMATAEKLADAHSVTEALNIQADYLRESARANVERVKSASETARDTIVEGARKTQAELSALYTRKAA